MAASKLESLIPEFVAISFSYKSCELKLPEKERLAHCFMAENLLRGKVNSCFFLNLKCMGKHS